VTLPSPVSVWVVSAEPSVPRKITFLGPFRLCDDRGRPQLLINRWADGVGGRACQMPVTQRAGLQGIPRPASWSALDPSTGELVCRGAPTCCWSVPGGGGFGCGRARRDRPLVSNRCEGAGDHRCWPFRDAERRHKAAGLDHPRYGRLATPRRRESCGSRRPCCVGAGGSWLAWLVAA